MQSRKITVTALAQAVGRSRKNMSDLVNGRANIDAELAHRLSTVLGTTARFWLNAQAAIDLWETRQNTQWQPKMTFEARPSV